MKKGYIIVEGHGEKDAAKNLVTRLWADLGLPHLPWAEPDRYPNLHIEKGIRKGCEVARAKRDTAALIILRDEDDSCPRDQGPTTADWIQSLNLPFPTAIVLFHREYEVLFLPCLHLMAGKKLRDRRGILRRPGLEPGTRFKGDPESVRGVKEWLSRHFPSNRTYKQTLDQLPLTRMIDFEILRQAALPCFGTLERALRFLSENRGRSGVYPPPARTRQDA